MVVQNLEEDNLQYVGPFVAYLRDKLELTQADISDDTGYSIQTISKLENGHSNPFAYASREIFQYVTYLANIRGFDSEKIFYEFCIDRKEVQ